MKTYLAGFTVIIFFVTQYPMPLLANEPNAPWVALTDIRLQLAEHIKAQGVYFQFLSDTRGEQYATEEFEKKTHDNMKSFFNDSEKFMANMSEKDANTILSAMTDQTLNSSDVDENMILVLADKDLTSRDKIELVYKNLSEKSFENDIAAIKTSIQMEGFAKTFSNIADELRGRARGAINDYGLGHGSKLFAWLFLAGEIALIIYAPLAFFGLATILVIYKCRHNFFTCE